MSYRTLLIASALFAASVIPAAAQGPGFFGYYDPATGAFTPVQPSVAAPTAGAQPTATVSRAGTFVFKITVKILSTLDPADTKPYCSAGVSHSAGSFYYSEGAQKNSTRNGITATCTLRMPYLWPNANDLYTVSPSFYVSGGGRSTSQNLPPIALPANGATTTFETTVRL